MAKRKICFIITSQIHYARSKLLLEAVEKHKDLELQIAVAASAILPQYGDVLRAMEEDGFTCNAKIIMTLAGGSNVAMAKTTGIGVTEFATAFDNLSPDIVVVRGDRYEVLAAAIAASYMNIPVAHLEGGDRSGTIDESVRHAVTKLSHIHFASNEESADRIRQMGENPDYVFNVGCPEIEYVASHSEDITNEEINYLGVGDPIDLSEPFLTVMFHPVTTEADNRQHTNTLLEVMNEKGMQTVWFWPNIDAGTDDIAKAIRTFREKKAPKRMHFMKYLSAGKFIALLKKTDCLIGNSSAGIKECSYLGTPVVNIGSRQDGRMMGPNVQNAGYDAESIANAIEQQLTHGRFEQSDIYFKSDTSKQVTDTLSTIDLYAQKVFFET